MQEKTKDHGQKLASSCEAMFSPKHLHERWSFHEESIRRMIREKRLPALRIGRRLRVPLSAVLAFEEKCAIVGHQGCGGCQ